MEELRSRLLCNNLLTRLKLNQDRENFVDLRNPSMAYGRLAKYEAVCTELIVFKQNFQVSSETQRLYFLIKGNKFTNLILVVDDLVFCTYDHEILNRVKFILEKHFQIYVLNQTVLVIGWQTTELEIEFIWDQTVHSKNF